MPDTDFLKTQFRILGISKIKKGKVNWLYPLGSEVTYQTRLLLYVDRMRDLYNEIVDSQLDSIISDRNLNFDSERSDSWSTDLDRVLNDYKKYLEDLYEEDSDSVILSIAIGVAIFNMNQWQKILRQKLGTDIFLSEPWLEDLVHSWISTNLGLIKDISDEAFKDIKVILNQSITRGLSKSEISKLILPYVEPKGDDKASVFRKAQNRARFIARDQVSKLDGKITQYRQTSLGIESYIWQTMRDEKVRSNHRTKDGKVFLWSEPPADTGHPTEDYNCRCRAIPNISELSRFLQDV